MFQNVPEYSGKFLNISECSRKFKMFKNILECSKIFLNFLPKRLKIKKPQN